MNPDLPCPHPHFIVYADVNRLVNEPGDTMPTGYVCDLRVNCDACGEDFRFCGVPAGYSAGHPTCSVKETELHIPIRPASSDPDFGLGIPGFSIRYVEGPASE